MKELTKIQNPFYQVEVVDRDGKKKEYVFRFVDLLLARAKAFARMEFELERNQSLSANVFFDHDGKRVNVSSRKEAGFRAAQEFEAETHSDLGFGDWSRLEDLYEPEIQLIIDGTEEKRQRVEAAIKSMKAAIDDIEDCESLFGDDTWFFDWVAAIQKRVSVLETAFECDMGYLKTA